MERILEEVRNKFPHLSWWVECCYSTSPFLNFGDRVVLSAAGVQQGDPLGPLLFSLLLHPVTERLQEVDGLELNAGYLNDRTLVRTPWGGLFLGWGRMRVG